MCFARQLRESAQLLTWYKCWCPDTSKPELSRTRSTSPSSQLLSTLFTCQQLRPRGYVSSPRPCCPMPNNYSGCWCPVRVCAAPAGPSFGFWPSFPGNLGQFWCCCECLRPFFIANHVIHPRCLCLLPPPPLSASTTTSQPVTHWCHTTKIVKVAVSYISKYGIKTRNDE